MTNDKTTTVLLAGVGGQGTILAADILARCAMASGYDVKVSEIHGMAQRGGSVTTIVRFGKKVQTMNVDLGGADILVSFEMIEGLRNIPYLAEGGKLVVSDELIYPTTVLTGKAPKPKNVKERLEGHGAQFVPAVRLALEAGTAKASNVVLLGALSAILPFSDDAWIDTVSKRVPAKFLEANLVAFNSGKGILA